MTARRLATIAAVALLVAVARCSGRPIDSGGAAPPPVVPHPLAAEAPPSNPRSCERWTSPSDGREMVWIPGGSFLMGSPANEAGREADEGQHRVGIDRGFWMDTTEVTSSAYAEFLETNRGWHRGVLDTRFQDHGYLSAWKTPMPSSARAYPVGEVSWYAARAFCSWAGKHLPTEAQWEYAARAGTVTAYWWGETFDATRANRNGRGMEPVGASNRTNAWGLSDMAGNVAEWVSSAYRPYPFRLDDGREEATARGMRVTRGGSYVSHPPYEVTNLRGAARARVPPVMCVDDIGFRCAR